MKRIIVGLTPNALPSRKSTLAPSLRQRNVYFSTVKLLMIAAKITGIAITIVNVSIILSFQSF